MFLYVKFYKVKTFGSDHYICPSHFLSNSDMI